MNALTYPARPVSAGLNTDKPFDWQIPGEWWFEPKANGWRMLVYVPERLAWNRRGEPSSIGSEFNGAMNKLEQAGVVWADTEALERRHNIGRGSLILLDVLGARTVFSPVTEEPYWKRRRFMFEGLLEKIDALRIDASNCGPNNLFILPTFRRQCSPIVEAMSDGSTPLDASHAWDAMKEANAKLKVPFWEGFVAKRTDSTYPIQLSNPEQEFKGWVKRRFLP